MATKIEIVLEKVKLKDWGNFGYEDFETLSDSLQKAELALQQPDVSGCCG